MQAERYLKVGHFSRTHGLKGGLVLNLSHGSVGDAPPEIFIMSEGQYKSMKVDSFSQRPDIAFIKLDGIDTLETAQRLRGHSVFLRRTEQEQAQQDILPGELVGMEVVDLNSSFSAVVVRVSDDGNRRFLLVIHDGREIILPFEKPFISSVDLSIRRINSDLPEGFAEI